MRAAVRFVLPLVAVASTLGVEDQLTEARARKLHEQLRPDANDVWLTIPWRIDLLEAQNLAAEEGRPLFIWAMDGHPLGCT